MFRWLLPGALGASVENLADGLALAEREGVRLAAVGSEVAAIPTQTRDNIQ